MGQKEKEIKAMATGLLANKIMYEVLYEAEQNVTDPKKLQWVKDNLRVITINRLNIIFDLLDKRRLTTEELNNLDMATQMSEAGYGAYLKGREAKEKEKAERKAMGEEVTPV
jgi:hypothetical protein